MADSTLANILMVDDHAPNLVALEAVLAPLGQRLLLATSGEEALRVLLREEVAVILMDVQMPGLDGFATASLIKRRERTRHIPIIFLSASSRDAAHVERGYEHGAVDYLVKPFDPEVLRTKVAAFIGLHQEARERHAQLEQRSEERFRALVDAVPLHVLALRPDGSVAYANSHYRTYAGLPAGSGEVPDSFAGVHPEDRPRLEAARAGARVEGGLYEQEVRLRRASDGAWRWHLARGVPERDGGGRVTGWVETATDIDQQKQAEQVLADANAAKDGFLAVTSHELRTPLAAAKMQVQLALRKLAGGSRDGLERSFRVVERQVERMARLVEDLLDVSMLQAGHMELHRERVNLAALARETLERVQALSARHPFRLEAPAALWTSADPKRLEQVLTNLLQNAIRYSPLGGEVEVGLAEADGGIHLWVRDRGVGIPPERQQDIFERFSRAHGSSYGGLGLGLTISHGIVAQHGGRIWVESSGRQGEGSTFHVHLPVDDAAAGEEPSTREAARAGEA